MIEEYTNGEYGATSAMMMWSDGGGSVFIFSKQGAKVAARWLDNQNLEVSIEKGIEFTMKDDCAYFCGDNVDITYKEI